jgi:hypothetical protein
VLLTSRIFSGKLYPFRCVDPCRIMLSVRTIEYTESETSVTGARLYTQKVNVNRNATARKRPFRLEGKSEPAGVAGLLAEFKTPHHSSSPRLPDSTARDVISGGW